MPSQLIHRVFIGTLQRQVTVLGISHQQSLALQIAGQAVRDRGRTPACDQHKPGLPAAPHPPVRNL